MGTGRGAPTPSHGPNSAAVNNLSDRKEFTGRYRALVAIMV